MNARTRIDRRAFTLIEVLLTTLLAAVLLVALWSLLSMYSKAFESGHARTEQAQLARTLLEQISVDLQGVVERPPAAPELAILEPTPIAPPSAAGSTSSGGNASGGNSAASGSGANSSAPKTLTSTAQSRAKAASRAGTGVSAPQALQPMQALQAQGTLQPQQPMVQPQQPLQPQQATLQPLQAATPMNAAPGQSMPQAAPPPQQPQAPPRPQTSARPLTAPRRQARSRPQPPPPPRSSPGPAANANSPTPTTTSVATSSLRPTGLFGTDTFLQIDVVQPAFVETADGTVPLDESLPGMEDKPSHAEDLKTIVYSFEELREAGKPEGDRIWCLFRRELDWEDAHPAAGGARKRESDGRLPSAAEALEATGQTVDPTSSDYDPLLADDSIVSVPEVIHFALRYFDGTTWSDEWDSTAGAGCRRRWKW